MQLLGFLNYESCWTTTVKGLHANGSLQSQAAWLPLTEGHMEFTQGGEMGHWSRAALQFSSQLLNSSPRQSDVLSGLHGH